MDFSLDTKDRRILYELDKDARISCSKLGKRVGLSTETTHYRVKRLEERGIIAQYQTAVDYGKLGVLHFKVCLRLNGLSHKDEETLYGRLKQLHHVIWIAKCRGDWDCILSCNAATLEELDEVKDRILAIAAAETNGKAVSLSSRIWSFPRSYLLGTQEERPAPKEGTITLDALDLRILRIISHDARKPVVEIAAEAETTAKIVTTRLQKLLKTGVIKNFRLVIDYGKLGLHFRKTLISLKKPDEERLRQLIERLNRDPHVIHNLKVVGEWDLEPEFEFEREEEFEAAIQGLQDEFADIIRRISVLAILKEYKYTFFYK